MNEEIEAIDAGGDSPVMNEQEWAGVYAAAAELDETDAPLTGEQSVNEESEIPSGALMADVVQVTADIFAPNWNIKREESEQLGAVYGALLDKYMPNSGLDKYGLELSALMVTAMVIKSRAGVPLKKVPDEEKEGGKKGEKNKEKQKESAPDSTVKADNSHQIASVVL
ncbi:hypothetical protein [Alteromonas lipotrueae]|uniref:hypothetical protein n=1 Tax=Alteromonas lipotrueae TaxID=2803814 RepID=UPI001C4950D4|nr:hypothetical protein [Alteromonas lipotrueae]